MNKNISADNYISKNPHFCKSALSRFNQYDFIALIEKYHIAYEERQFGQLFCIDSAKQILDMLLTECHINRVNIMLNTDIIHIDNKQNSKKSNNKKTTNKTISKEKKTGKKGAMYATAKKCL